MLVFCVSNSPQKRHPERSASPIYRVTQRLVARSRRACPESSRGNLGGPYLPMPLGAFQPPKPAPGGPAPVFPRAREPRTCSHLAIPGGCIYILGSASAPLACRGIIRGSRSVHRCWSSARRRRSLTRSATGADQRRAWSPGLRRRTRYPGKRGMPRSKPSEPPNPDAA
jgi:hypothetical protein